MLERIAYNIGRNDEAPNIELAELLCDTNDRNGIAEITEGLNNKNKLIANDCIKVLYEIGESRPELIAEYCGTFLELLYSKNNRMVWGCMTALSCIADICAEEIFKRIDAVIYAYEKGSVITVDNSISVLAKVCKADTSYEEKLFPLLIKHLTYCRPKEIAQHAERMAVCINSSNKAPFFDVIEQRRTILTAPQQSRLDKLLRQL